MEQTRVELNFEARHKNETDEKLNCVTKQRELLLESTKPSDILVRSDTKALTVTSCDTRSAQFPSTSSSSSIMLAMFEYEMRLQQARASADLDRQIAEAHLASERYKVEQERSRADIVAMKMRMLQFNF